MIVEKGIPAPAVRPTHIGPKYPFREMDLGDSFLVPGSAERNRALATAWHFSRSKLGKGRKFATRKVAEGYRIWRIL